MAMNAEHFEKHLEKSNGRWYYGSIYDYDLNVIKDVFSRKKIIVEFQSGVRKGTVAELRYDMENIQDAFDDMSLNPNHTGILYNYLTINKPTLYVEGRKPFSAGAISNYPYDLKVSVVDKDEEVETTWRYTKKEKEDFPIRLDFFDRPINVGSKVLLALDGMKFGVVSRLSAKSIWVEYVDFQTSKKTEVFGRVYPQNIIVVDAFPELASDIMMKRLTSGG